MRRMESGVFVLLTSILIAGCQGTPVVQGQGSVVVGDSHSRARVSIVFSDRDRRYVHDYYYARYRETHRHREHEMRKPVPPGLAKRKQLPPGLAKRDRLPHGVSGYPLPRELDRRLSSLPPGISRVRIGAQIVLIDDRTRVVLDVIQDIPLD